MILAAHIIGGFFAAIGVFISVVVIWQWDGFVRGFKSALKKGGWKIDQ